MNVLGLGIVKTLVSAPLIALNPNPEKEILLYPQAIVHRFMYSMHQVIIII